MTRPLALRAEAKVAHVHPHTSRICLGGHAPYRSKLLDKFAALSGHLRNLQQQLGMSMASSEVRFSRMVAVPKMVCARMPPEMRAGGGWDGDAKYLRAAE